MPFLGAHLSIAGGYYKAAEAAGRLGMETVQVFTKSNVQWRAAVITDEEAARFRGAVKEAGLQRACAHASYLINLASADEVVWGRSVEGFAVELERAELLGLVGVVVHPGAATGIGERAGIGNVVRALDVALAKSKSETVEVWLEVTAGQGASLGHRFEHLAEVIGRVERPERMGVCLDTCHLFAAGYPLSTAEEFAGTVAEFERVIGLKWLRAVHLNDSKKPFGSRVDRHEHIGEGYLGDEPFRHF
jgi:deoxyribonuclease IV